MRRSRCTIDSSCLIALNHLDLLQLLSHLYYTVLVPKAVREELSRRRRMKDRMQRLFETFAAFQRCDDYDRGAVDVMLVDRKRDGKRDRGEAEAVVQASANLTFAVGGVGTG